MGEEIKIFPKDKYFQAEHSGWWFFVFLWFVWGFFFKNSKYKFSNQIKRILHHCDFPKWSIGNHNKKIVHHYGFQHCIAVLYSVLPGKLCPSSRVYVHNFNLSLSIFLIQGYKKPMINMKQIVLIQTVTISVQLFHLHILSNVIMLPLSWNHQKPRPSYEVILMLSKLVW